MSDIDKESFFLITLDSCRYDTYSNANTPNLDNIGKVHKAFAAGNFTLPSHMGMFCGFTPGDPKSEVDFVNPKVKRFWKLGDDDQGTKGHLISLPGTNIVDGFNKLGYETIGTGGVEWFNPARVASKMLIDRFRHFEYFGTFFYLSRQVEWLMERIKACRGKRKFIFLNVGETHLPYWHEGAPWDESQGDLLKERYDRRLSEYRQKKCLEFVDNALKRLLEETADYNIIVCGDHGDAWGEDGLWHHSIHHEKVYEVPLVIKVNTDVDYAAISRGAGKGIDDVVEKDQAIKLFDKILAGRDEKIRELEDSLAQKDTAFAEQNRRLREAYDDMASQRVDFDRQFAEKHSEMDTLRLEYDKRLVHQERSYKESFDSYEARLLEKDHFFAESNAAYEARLKEKDRLFDEQLRQKDALFADLERRFLEKDRQMAELVAEHCKQAAEIYAEMARQRAGFDAEMDAMNRRMTDFERQLYEKDERMAAEAASYEGRLAEKDSRIAGLDGRLSEQGGVLDEREQELRARNRLIEDMLRSLSWRVTAPLRRILGLFVSGRR